MSNTPDTCQPGEPIPPPIRRVVIHNTRGRLAGVSQIAQLWQGPAPAFIPMAQLSDGRYARLELTADTARYVAFIERPMPVRANPYGGGWVSPARQDGATTGV